MAKYLARYEEVNHRCGSGVALEAASMDEAISKLKAKLREQDKFYSMLGSKGRSVHLEYRCTIEGQEESNHNESWEDILQG